MHWGLWVVRALTDCLPEWPVFVHAACHTCVHELPDSLAKWLAVCCLHSMIMKCVGAIHAACLDGWMDEWMEDGHNQWCVPLAWLGTTLVDIHALSLCCKHVQLQASATVRVEHAHKCINMHAHYKIHVCTHMSRSMCMYTLYTHTHGYVSLRLQSIFLSLGRSISQLIDSPLVSERLSECRQTAIEPSSHRLID